MGDEFTAHSVRAVAKPREFAVHSAQAIVIANIQDKKGHRHHHDVIVTALQSHRSLSLSFGGWLFWLLLVGWFWLMVVGWSGCGCEIWDGYEIWDGLRSGCGLWEWDLWLCSVCLSFFFFFLVAVANIGGQWLICGGGRCGGWSAGVGCCCCWWWW